MTTNQNQFGCLDKVDYGNVHQLQFWLHGFEHGYKWEVRNAYVPGGKFVRSCELASGFNPEDYAEARRLGQAEFDRRKAEELAKVGAPTAAAQNSSAAVS